MSELDNVLKSISIYWAEFTQTYYLPSDYNQAYIRMLPEFVCDFAKYRRTTDADYNEEDYIGTLLLPDGSTRKLSYAVSRWGREDGMGCSSIPFLIRVLRTYGYPQRSIRDFANELSTLIEFYEEKQYVLERAKELAFADFLRKHPYPSFFMKLWNKVFYEH